MNEMEGGRPMDEPDRCPECNGAVTGIYQYHKLDCSQAFLPRKERGQTAYGQIARPAEERNGNSQLIRGAGVYTKRK